MKDLKEILKHHEEENCHCIHIDDKAKANLDSEKLSRIEEYFEKINKKEISSGRESIYSNIKDKFKIVLPKNYFDLKLFLDDLRTILNS